MSSTVAVSGERLQKRGEPLAAADVASLRAGASLRAFMSSIMRWRSGLIVSVLIGNSCLGEVDDTSILKTGRPLRYR